MSDKIKKVKVLGVNTVHELGDKSFRFEAAGGEVNLVGDINRSDQSHLMAAYTISREFSVLVIWQDMYGRKHFVESGEVMLDAAVITDPRDKACPTMGSVQ